MPEKRDNGWTISTLKELFDTKFAARDQALDLQATETLRRLGELNHEHARVLLAQQASVSKDTWDGYIKADQVWKSRVDIALQGLVSRTEFQTYKDATEKALTLRTGQSTGRGEVFAWIISAISTMAAVASILYATRVH